MQETTFDGVDMVTNAAFLLELLLRIFAWTPMM